MNIVHFTNTYPPQVGGVAISVSSFVHELRRRGHRVFVVAPQAASAPPERDVIRIPAVENVAGTIFSLVLPSLHPSFFKLIAPGAMLFNTDVIHSHHPWLLGDTAQKLARMLRKPLIYTYHTTYGNYAANMVPGDAKIPAFTSASSMAVSYAKRCACVIAPSRDIGRKLQGFGISGNRLFRIPTGIDVHRFQNGNGNRFRKKYKIDAGDFLIGHVGRLTGEKNLGLFSDIVIQYMNNVPAKSSICIAGEGQYKDILMSNFSGYGNKVRFVGNLLGDDLSDAYDAMNVFLFTSTTETQGMVLAEAMAAGTPVVALEAPGVRDIVDKTNGVMISNPDVNLFVRTLNRLCTDPNRLNLSRGARNTAWKYSIEVCTDRLIALYTLATMARGRR